MTLGAKILAALAVLCFLVWGLAHSLGIQPLLPADGLEVIYGEQEDFHADGRAFRKFRNRDLVIVYLPQAGTGRQWWTVDFWNGSIADTEPPHSVAGWRFVMKGDLEGPAIGAEGAPDEWLWHFDENVASFAGRSFTCLVRRTGAQ